MSNIQDNPMPSGGGVAQPNAQGQATSWLDSLPEDIRSSSSLTKFNSVESLARGYMNAEQLIGRDKIPMPRTDDEYMEVYRRLGAPADAAGYTFDPKAYEQYGEWATKDLDMFKGMAIKAGLTQKQAETLFNEYVNSGVERLKAADVDFELAKQNARQALVQKYGQAYDSNMAKANRALSYLASPELIDALTNTGIANNPEFVDMMVRIAPKFVEENGIDRSQGEQVSAQQLNDQLMQLMTHPAFTDGNHPEHRMVVDKVTSIYQKMANG